MLALQTDVYSDFDHILAERLAYAIDHAKSPSSRLKQTADLLRTFNGRMTTGSAAAEICAATHALLWPMLLRPHLKSAQPLPPEQIQALYLWAEKDYALEQILQHTPTRWLPPLYSSWDDFLAAAVDQALTEAKAPADLSTWSYGPTHTVDLEHPIFDASSLLRRFYARPTGTGPHPQSGDGTTIKQVGRTFGPSERFTADLANPDNATLNLPLGQSSNPASPNFQDQFQAWLRGTTFPFPFTHPTSVHSLTLTP